MIVTLRLSQIVRDPSLLVRARILEEKVKEYTNLIHVGKKLPPIDVFEAGQHLLVDGWHRCAACEAARQEEIQATLHQGTRLDALLFAVKANSAHGIYRSNADKRRVVEVLLREPTWTPRSDRLIAEACNLDDHYLVGEVRRWLESTGEIPQFNKRIGADGKSRSLRVVPPKAKTPVEPPVPESRYFTSPETLLSETTEPLSKETPHALLLSETPSAEQNSTPAQHESSQEKPVYLRSNSQDWCTPPEVLERIRRIKTIGLDPCSNQWSQVNARVAWVREDDGLSRSWSKTAQGDLIFVNPPFDNAEAWARRCAEEHDNGAEIVLLTPARVGSKWYQDLVLTRAKVVLFWRGRLRYWQDGQPGESATFDTSLAYYGGSAALFAGAFDGCGVLLYPQENNVIVQKAGAR